MLKIDFTFVKDYVSAKDLLLLEDKVLQAHDFLHATEDSKFLGWLKLPFALTDEIEAKINFVANFVRKADVFVVIGVGGSYLGAKAFIESFDFLKSPKIYFLGTNLDPTYIHKIIAEIKDKDIFVNIVSKSGTTLEPLVSFLLLYDFMRKRYTKEELKERIIVTTGKKGFLRDLALKEGFVLFDIEEDVLGRYSVLSSVGLLPMAVKGIDIKEVLKGARDASLFCRKKSIEENLCYKYAALRNLLYKKGKFVEFFVFYKECLIYFGKWLEQLFAESQGKKFKGILPVTTLFTTDLHSLGQYLQEGKQMFFETVIFIKKSVVNFTIPKVDFDISAFNYLEGKDVDVLNNYAYLSTLYAHSTSLVPNIVLSVEELTPYTLGWLTFFFQKACAISCYLLDVNPFDQPGVEKYKKKMRSYLKQVE